MSGQAPFLGLGGDPLQPSPPPQRLAARKLRGSLRPAATAFRAQATSDGAAGASFGSHNAGSEARDGSRAPGPLARPVGARAMFIPGLRNQIVPLGAGRVPKSHGSDATTARSPGPPRGGPGGAGGCRLHRSWGGYRRCRRPPFPRRPCAPWKMAASASAVQLTSFVFRSTTISSPFSTNAIGPPSAASGPT